MRVRRTTAAIVGGLSLALVAAGCGGGGGSGDSGSGGEGGGNEGGTVSVWSGEPENPLIPTNTNESGGGKVLDVLFSQLIHYDSKTGEPQMDVAKSIESNEDSTKFTIKIKDGLKFHDGSDLTAESFVKAWNYGAYGPNAQLNSSWFDFIKGYKQVHPEDPDGPDGPEKAPKPEAKELSGLKVQDDTTFTVEANKPYLPFKTVVGYNAFAPLPDAFFDDPDAFGDKPVGNGPFKFESWQHNQQIKVSAWDGYQGDRKPKIDAATFKLYTQPEPGYRDVQAGNLDYLVQVPSGPLVNQKFKKDFPEDQVKTYDSMGNTTMSFPLFQKKYQDVHLRRAISMAIDREAIVKNVFFGAKGVANNFVPDIIPGADALPDCENCKFNADKAKQEFGQSNKPDQVELYYNADGSHKAWNEAACGSIRDVLGIDCKAVPVTTFSQFRQKINAKEIPGIFRSGWYADYPEIDNFLAPLYVTGGSSNDAKYSNEKVDQAYEEGLSKNDIEAANKAWAKGFEQVGKDMPAVPMFTTSRQTVYAKRLENVVPNVRSGYLDLTKVTVAS